MGKSMRNPSLQCSVCGKWKRLHGKDPVTGLAIQRFHGSGEVNGVIHDHEKEVCDDCCQKGCPYDISGVSGTSGHGNNMAALPRGTGHAKKVDVGRGV